MNDVYSKAGLHIEIFKVTSGGRRKISGPIYLSEGQEYNFLSKVIVKANDFLDPRDTEMKVTKRFTYEFALTLVGKESGG